MKKGKSLSFKSEEKVELLVISLSTLRPPRDLLSTSSSSCSSFLLLPLLLLLQRPK